MFKRRRLTRSVTQQRLSYLEPTALRDLYDAAKALTGPGSIVEAGCALGGSSIILAAAKEASRPMFVYDVFGMIPSPGEADGRDVQERYKVIAAGDSPGIGGETYYGYRDNLLGEVVESFTRYGLDPGKNAVRFIKGLYEDTLYPPQPVALAHIDCDWYESVKTCLTRLDSRMVPGGRIVIDDYDAWSGCRTAVDEFLTGSNGRYSTTRKTRLHLIRR